MILLACARRDFFVAAGPAQAQAARGTIRLWVDATSAPQKILHAKETIPVKAGALTLYYPEWIPGEHAPDGPITNLAGLKFIAGGKEIPWRRDLVDMFAFHLDVPAGADSLEVQLDFLLSAPATGFSAGASATARARSAELEPSAAVSEGLHGERD